MAQLEDDELAEVIFELFPHLPEGMTHSAVPLHSYGQGEVDGPGEPHLGHGQEHGDHVQVGGVSPEGGEEAGQTEDGDRENDIDEVKCSKCKHQVVEVLEDDLAGEPDDADGVPNNSEASNK